MTNRILRDPNSLPSEPSLQDIRQVLIDLWSITSVFVSRETDNYSITGNVSHEIVIAANTTPKTVTMIGEPEDGHMVTVAITNSQITIDGNGKNINGSLTLVLSTIADSTTMIFSSDDDGWWTIGNV